MAEDNLWKSRFVSWFRRNLSAPLGLEEALTPEPAHLGPDDERVRRNEESVMNLLSNEPSEPLSVREISGRLMLDSEVVDAILAKHAGQLYCTNDPESGELLYSLLSGQSATQNEGGPCPVTYRELWRQFRAEHASRPHPLLRGFCSVSLLNSHLVPRRDWRPSHRSKNHWRDIAAHLYTAGNGARPTEVSEADAEVSFATKDPK
jgi:hypothetical protein